MSEAKNDTQYEIIIADNGVGLDKDTVKALNDALERDDVLSMNTDNDFENLHSINLRIKIAYGNEFGISVKGEKGKGMQTIFLLPRQ